MSSNVASLKGITRVYHKPGTDVEVAALRGVNVDLVQGQYTAIMGASGSGKSTMMNIIGCLDRPSSGAYILGGDNVSQLDDDRLSMIRSTRIGFVFQNFNLIQQLTVLENLEVPMFYRGIDPKERRERATKLAERVGLGERLDHRPTQLSGGQQQRVCIARSLVNDPLILLADEPTGALDSKTGVQILDLFDELVAGGTTVILVTHDSNVAARCERVIRLADGEVISDEIKPSRRPAASAQ
jgi:putative ABC transport system ATP-binding protein